MQHETHEVDPPLRALDYHLFVTPAQLHREVAETRLPVKIRPLLHLVLPSEHQARHFAHPRKGRELLVWEDSHLHFVVLHSIVLHLLELYEIGNQKSYILESTCTWTSVTPFKSLVEISETSMTYRPCAWLSM